jgi:hypothetical protein
MTRRIRLLGALVTLVALTAYFAESVRASMCLPGMDMDMAVAGAESNPHAGMEHGTAGDPDAPRTDLPECPLGMAGMGSSCVAMLIPATAATTIGASEADVAGATSIASLHDLLISAARFRPPRI